MTAPPAGALDIVERLRRCATTMINDDQSEPETRLRQRMVERVEAINDAADALLAALRLREGCEARIRAWRAGGPGLIDQQHVIYDYCADDLARVLEEGE